MSKRTQRLAVALMVVAASSAVEAQVPVRASITATGEASVSANPDQAMLSFSVLTTAVTAVDAGNLNASQTSGVISALRAVMGASDTLKTISYSLNPNYNNAAMLTGYTAVNSIQVTTGDLASTGRLIDTATQAGVSRVQSLAEQQSLL